MSICFDKEDEATSEAQPSTPDLFRGTEASETKSEEGSRMGTAPGQASAKVAPISSGVEEMEEKWRNLPEIVLFWARNRRRGGNLVVCPDKSMDRLIQAYLVCEVVEASTAKQPA